MARLAAYSGRDVENSQRARDGVGEERSGASRPPQVWVRGHRLQPHGGRSTELADCGRATLLCGTGEQQAGVS